MKYNPCRHCCFSDLDDGGTIEICTIGGCKILDEAGEEE